MFEWPLRVYIEDTDAGGIVYYVNYLKFMERARTEFLRAYGFGKNYIFNQDLMFVVHSLNSQYLKPAKLDDHLIVTASILKSGSAYLLLEQRVYRPISANEDNAAEKELLCKGEVKIACVDRQTMKPKKIPQDMLKILLNESYKKGEVA